MSIKLTAALRLGTPLAAAAAAVVLARYYIAPGVDLEGMSRGLAGPGTWPKAMLYCATGCLLAIFARGVLELRRIDTAGTAAAASVQEGPAYDDAKLMRGMALLV